MQSLPQLLDLIFLLLVCFLEHCRVVGQLIDFVLKLVPLVSVNLPGVEQVLNTQLHQIYRLQDVWVVVAHDVGVSDHICVGEVQEDRC